MDDFKARVCNHAARVGIDTRQKPVVPDGMMDQHFGFHVVEICELSRWFLSTPIDFAWRTSRRRGNVPSQDREIEPMLETLAKPFELLVGFRLSLHGRGTHLQGAIHRFLRTDPKRFHDGEQRSNLWIVFDLLLSSAGTESRSIGRLVFQRVFHSFPRRTANTDSTLPPFPARSCSMHEARK